MSPRAIPIAARLVHTRSLALFLALASSTGCRVGKQDGKHADSTAALTVKSAAPAVPEPAPKFSPKDLVGYMGIPWGASSEQVLQMVFHGEPRDYGSSSGLDGYEVDIRSEKFGRSTDVSYFFTPDKAKLKMVVVYGPHRHKKGTDTDGFERACLEEITGEFGPPAHITRQEFGGGIFIMRRWRFPTTKILLGRYRSSYSPDADRLILRYSPARAQVSETGDLRDWLYPYFGKGPAQSAWKMGIVLEPQEITQSEDEALLNGGQQAKH